MSMCILCKESEIKWITTEIDGSMECKWEEEVEKTKSRASSVCVCLKFCAKVIKNNFLPNEKSAFWLWKIFRCLFFFSESKCNIVCVVNPFLFVSIKVIYLTKTSFWLCGFVVSAVWSRTEVRISKQPSIHIY